MINRSTLSGLNKVLCYGIIGCVLMGLGDWLMIYGDTSFEGNLPWLTLGVADIEPWRNNLAMLLSFPAIIFYSIALFALVNIFKFENNKRSYTILTALGLTPWLCLHLFYTMILFAFSYMSNNGLVGEAYTVCEAVFNHFAWIIPVAEVLMLIPFIYLFVLIITGKSILNKKMAFVNPLIVYIILKGITMLMPNEPFRLAFVNGLMSESMLVCFLAYIIYLKKSGITKR